MKIVINTRFLLPGKIEGIGRFTYEIVSRMVKAHPEDEFIFLFDRPYDPSFIFAPNVRPVVLQPPTRHPLLIVLWFEWSVYRFLKKEQPDIFFSPDGFVSLRSKIPTVSVTHDLAYLHQPEHISKSALWFYRWFVPRYLAHSKQVISVSEATKSDILQNFPSLQKDIYVVYNSCSEEFKPLNTEQKHLILQKYSEGQPYFFYLGALQPRKNIYRLVKAFDIFKQRTQSDTKLVLSGRFAWKTVDIQEAIKKSPFTKDIILTGYIEKQELNQLLGSALGLVYVSLFEGFGLPLVEAMQSGVPVITSNCSSMPEVVGDAGILVNPHSEQSIAEGMEELYCNLSLQSELILKGLEQAKKFDWDKSAAQVYAFLQNTLD